VQRTELTPLQHEYLKVMGNPAFGDAPNDPPPGPPECPKTLQGPAGARS
jgi:hypothetical protein